MSEATEDEAESRQEQEVVVFGSHTERVQGEPEVSSAVISEQQLQEPGADASSVLSRVAGVQVNRTGTASDLSTLSIRGSSANQVPVYLGGIRMNDDVVGVFDLSRVPLWMLYRVSVYRTTVPLLSLRPGLSGAVDFEPRLESSSGARAGALVGSFGSGAAWVGGTWAHPLEKDDQLRLGATSLSFRRSGAQNDYSYLDDSGTAFDQQDDERRIRQNADFAQDDLWIISHQELGTPQHPVRVKLIANGFVREQGVANLALLPTESARSRFRRGLLALSMSAGCGLSRHGCTLHWVSAGTQNGLRTSDPDSELSLGAPLVDQRAARVTQRAQLDLFLSPVWVMSTALGVEHSQLRSDSGADAEGLSPLVRASETMLAGVGALSYRKDRVLLRGSARLNCAPSRGVLSADDQFVRRSPCAGGGRLGASVGLNRSVSLRSSVSVFSRFPTLGERYGVSAGTRGLSDLEVERGYTVDLGGILQRRLGRHNSFVVDWGASQRVTTDLINYRRSSLGYFRPENVGRAHFLSAELSTFWDLFGHLRARGGLAWVMARDLSLADSPEIPFVAPLTANADLEAYHEHSGRWFPEVSLSLKADYRAGRVVDPAGLIVVPEQFVLSLSAVARIVQDFSVQVSVDNLLDTQRFDLLGFPLPGRSAFLNAQWEHTWGKNEAGPNRD